MRIEYSLFTEDHGPRNLIEHGPEQEGFFRFRDTQLELELRSWAW